MPKNVESFCCGNNIFHFFIEILTTESTITTKKKKQKKVSTMEPPSTLLGKRIFSYSRTYLSIQDVLVTTLFCASILEKNGQKVKFVN